VSVPITAQATFAATLVDEWIRAGVRDAVVCPGSRSTPLALALADRPELALHVRLDERGAAFFAIGCSLATGQPTILCTTSGTAAAELHPGVVEAHHAAVPLLVCTADRPPSLHGIGASQTIDQRGLFGTATRWSAEPGVVSDSDRDWWRSLAARALIEARDAPTGPGPVHLNLAFADPLVGAPGELPPGRAGTAPWHRGRANSGGLRDADLRRSVEHWASRRGVVVVGAGGGSPAAVFALAEALGWPVLADPRSGCRLSRPGAVAAADAILRDGTVRAALAPDVVLALGAPWASKVLAAYVAESARAGASVVAVERWGRWFDPDRLVAEQWAGDPDAWLGAAAGLVSGAQSVYDWEKRWRAAEDGAQRAIEATLLEDAADRGGVISEPAFARRLLSIVPNGTPVVTSSSMPMRDLEWYTPTLAAPPRVLANRGANGIDGVCSTAQGVAAGGSPVVGVVGDLAFFHDVSSLVRPLGSAEGPCTLVVVDNGGGGIFNFLPQAGLVEGSRFESLFGTPQSPSVEAVAQGFGLPTVRVGSVAELDSVIAAPAAGLRVLHVPVPPRDQNVALHGRIDAAVAVATRAAIGV
jgi:2-succinyl-5-enolpyruvyl-6-hydroxy-3-cyclohexene-1-carboxylate synthase